ncbi:hypothetical protein ACG7TL_000864 [Trametes sanguinea]
MQLLANTLEYLLPPPSTTALTLKRSHPPHHTAQKNKATEYHLGLLKAKLARYRAQLLEPTTKSGGAGTGFDVQKSGDARVALIGFPSVGKSTLLSKCTHTQSESAAYEFTTLTAIPGVIEHQGARIQLLDLPGIVEGASEGRGRGRQVVATAKTADLILIMLDATKSEEQRRLLEIELDAVGIRLNKKRPDVVFKRKTTGGITINKTVPLTKTDEKTIRTILASYVYNKIDAISLERMDQLAREDHTVVISCELGLNLDYLIERIWEELDLVKVYTKKRGAHPDLADPICLRKGATVEGKSSKFNPHAQKVGLNHHVADEDVVSSAYGSTLAAKLRQAQFAVPPFSRWVLAAWAFSD